MYEENYLTAATNLGYTVDNLAQRLSERLTGKTIHLLTRMTIHNSSGKFYDIDFHASRDNLYENNEGYIAGMMRRVIACIEVNITQHEAYTLQEIFRKQCRGGYWNYAYSELSTILYARGWIIEPQQSSFGVICFLSDAGIAKLNDYGMALRNV